VVTSTHPPLRGTLSQRERDRLQECPSPNGRGIDFRNVPLPLGEGGAKRRVRVEVLRLCRPTADTNRLRSDVLPGILRKECHKIGYLSRRHHFPQRHSGHRLFPEFFNSDPLRRSAILHSRQRHFRVRPAWTERINGDCARSKLKSECTCETDETSLCSAVSG